MAVGTALFASGAATAITTRIPGGTVRLKWCLVEVVEVRFHAVKNREVSNRNCVVATRGGEQRNENGQSVTKSRHTETSELDSVSDVGRACCLKAKPVAESQTLWQWKSDMEKSPRSSNASLMIGDRMAGRPNTGIRETRQCWWVREGQQSAHLAGGSQSVHSSDEAGNDRGAKGTQEGGRMQNGITDNKPTQVPARAKHVGTRQAHMT
jgi:hypothetical protein